MNPMSFPACDSASIKKAAAAIPARSPLWNVSDKTLYIKDRDGQLLPLANSSTIANLLQTMEAVGNIAVEVVTNEPTNYVLKFTLPDGSSITTPNLVNPVIIEDDDDGSITIPSDGGTSRPTATVNTYLGAVSPSKHVLLLWPVSKTDTAKSRLVGQLYESGDDIDTLSNVLISTRLERALTSISTIAGSGSYQNRVVRVRMMVGGVLTKFIGIEFMNRKAADIYLNGWFDVSKNLAAIPTAYSDADFVGDPMPVTGTTDSSVSVTAATQAAFRSAVASVPDAADDSDESYIKYTYSGETNANFADDLLYIRAYLGSSSKRVCLDLSELPITTIRYSSNYNYLAFEGVLGISSVILPKTLTALIQRAFRGCTNLKSVTFTGSALTSIPYLCFAGCTGLISVKAGSKLVEIEQEAFLACSSLESIRLPGTSKPTVDYHTFYQTPTGVRMFVPSALLAAYVADARYTSPTVGALTSPIFTTIS